MKLPKTRNKYCPFCKKHTEHKLLQSKKKAASTLKKGSKVRMRLRGLARGTGNLGRISKGALTKWKRYGKKATKKTDLRFECKECKKSHPQKKGFRAKRVEFA
jgi:large subunit ribosomal protein L44e